MLKNIVMQNRTREVLHELGLKQVDVAAKLGMTNIGFAQLLKVERPKISTLERVADAIGVPVWRLFLSDEEIEQVAKSANAKNTPKAVCPVCGTPLQVKLFL